MKDLRIAAVCMTSSPGRTSENLARMESFVREASERSVDVICFPEFSLSGFPSASPEGLYSRADSEDLLAKIVEMARKNHLVIIAGLIEITDRQRPYISQIVAGPEGLLGIHRKTHLSPPEKEIYRAGQRLGVHESEKAVFGVQLCYEAHFPELSTVMALKGADVVFIPHASPHGDPEDKFQSWLRHLPARAFDNSIYIVACNQVGAPSGTLPFPGVAMVLNPLGRLMDSYRGEKENMLVADLKGKELREIRAHRMKSFLPNRKPALYGDLVLKIDK